MNKKQSFDGILPATEPTKEAYPHAAGPPVIPQRPLSTRSYSQPLRPKKPSKAKYFLLATPLVILLAAGAVWYYHKPPPPKPVKTIPSRVVEPEVVPQPPIDAVAVKKQLAAIIKQHPELQISVSFEDLKSAIALHSGEDDPYIAASTTKLLAAALFLKQTETGQHRLSEPLGGSTAQERLRAMIEDSDNVAWADFEILLGLNTLQKYAVQIGLKDYNSKRNTTTSSDIALLLKKLYDNQLLNEKNTKLLLRYMQKASEAQYIPQAIPSGIKVYHKAGYLQDRAHDAAIVDDGKQPFVLVIFTSAASGKYNFEVGKNLMHEITNVILAGYRDI